MEIVHVILTAVISEIEIIGLCRILRTERIDLLDHRHHTQTLAQGTHAQVGLLGILHIALEYLAGYLEVTETLFLGLTQKRLGERLERVIAVKLGGGIYNILQTIKKPSVNLSEFMYALHRVTLEHRLGYGEYALVSRLLQSVLQFGKVTLIVAYKSMHTLPYHAQTLLNSLLKGAADSHHLAHRLHRRAYLAAHAVKFSEVPARYLAHYIVEGRLKESRRLLGHRVFEVKQSVTQTELGCNESERIAGSLGGESRRAAQTGVDLDDAIVHRLWVEGILHVTFAHNADVAYDFDGKLAQPVIILI